MQIKMIRIEKTNQITCGNECKLMTKLNDALKEIDRLRSLLDEKDRIIEELNEELNEYNECYDSLENTNTEIEKQLSFLKKDNGNLKQTNEYLRIELDRLKDKIEVKDLDSFMKIYGSIMDRGELKVIINKFYEMAGIKLTQTKAKDELKSLGLCVKTINKNGISAYITKKTEGIMYIVQLKNDEGSNVYKVGRTINMNSRKNLYERYNGGVNEIKSVKVNDMFSCESELLKEMNKRFGKSVKGNEYFEGELSEIECLFDEVVNKYKD